VVQARRDLVGQAESRDSARGRISRYVELEVPNSGIRFYRTRLRVTRMVKSQHTDAQDTYSIQNEVGQVNWSQLGSEFSICCRQVECRAMPGAYLTSEVMITSRFRLYRTDISDELERRPFLFATSIMSIDPDDPGRKTVFKVNTNKLGFSKNTPEACGYCQRKRSDGETPLRLCSGCRSIRFCVSISWEKPGSSDVFCRMRSTRRHIGRSIKQSARMRRSENKCKMSLEPRRSSPWRNTAAISLRTGSQSIAIPYLRQWRGLFKTLPRL
jgi:hypothetical protein